MIFITDELGKFEKNIIELAENVGFKECKTIEAIDLFCGISERNDVLKEKDRYYAFIDIPQYWSVRADGLNGAIYDNKTKKANIYFKNPIEKRMVSRVEWIDRNNTVYKVDYYNKYGYMYCSENVSGGNVTVREFYDRNGDIKVLEQTGPKTYTTFGTRISPKSYRGFADYLEAYLKYNKIYDENIWLTSDEILNKFAWDYGNFKISYLPQNRLNSDLTVITQTNLKKVNDVHGHKAGDRALKLIGNLLAKETENETFAACRLGGDEFLIFMPYSDRASVESVIKRIFEGFESAREADCEIKEAALSAGLCMTTKGAMFESDYTKADKALYYVKQNCKGSYFFYEQLLADNKENTNLSADLRNVAKLLKESGSYTGALDLNYREFARIYEFVNNVGDRHNHNCYLVMVTMNTLPEQLADIEEIEKALDCMEQSIRSKIRKVDVCTRYSSMQYLIILFEPQENQIPNVMERIFMHYYELCDRENFKPQYEYIKMTEVK